LHTHQCDGIAFVAPNEELVVGGGDGGGSNNNNNNSSFVPPFLLPNWIIVLLKLSTGQTLHPGLIPL
jgi:hypothetical protein